MNEASNAGLPVTAGRALSVWWSYTWRITCVMFTLGLIGGVLIGAAGLALHGQPTEGTVALVGLFWLVWLGIAVAVNVWGISRALQVRYGDFEIRLVPRADR